MIRLLTVIALGTAGFGMADVLLEPFGGQVLLMSVAETTRLTVFLACGSLVGFVMASRWLGAGVLPIQMAIYGAAIGIPAFGLIVWSSTLLSVPVLWTGTVLAGFGAGLFAHGTLTATMRSAPRDQIGLSLGAWGAVQATSAGIAIALGGVIRDVIVAKETIGASAATPYTSVFALEAGLLTLGLLLALPLRGKTGLRKTTLEAAEISYPTGVKDAQTAASPLVEGRAG
jgi:BCD family chlorophyll transporter-like MFS transporter